MGITGLLPFLKKIHQPVNISDFSGCTVAIDAYCWLHKGAFSCAEKLAMGEKTDQYVYYCMKYIDYMLRKDLKPIMVFDGCHLKSKEGVEKSRREKRELNRKKAAQFLREGKKNEAKECLQRCIDVTPQMALNLMNVCRDRGVDCIVAPYEADAQLAYLNLTGIAQLIVTEDSDLLLFGCEKVIFKMDFFGNGMLIEKSRLNEVLSIQASAYSFEKFRYMCILSGCDYLPSLYGVGLGKASKVFAVARQPELRLLLKKLPTYLKMNVSITEEYVTGFEKANNTFLYQLVFCPLQRRLMPLNPYPPDLNKDELEYAGQYFPEEKAYQIALGNIDIHTHRSIAFFDPLTFQPKKTTKPQFRHLLSIWDRDYRVKPLGSPCKVIQPTAEKWQSSHGRTKTVHLHLPTKTHEEVKPIKDPGVLDKKSEMLLMSQYGNDPPTAERDRQMDNKEDDRSENLSQKENQHREEIEDDWPLQQDLAVEDDVSEPQQFKKCTALSPKKGKKRKIPSWLEETEIKTETVEEPEYTDEVSPRFDVKSQNLTQHSPGKARNVFAKSPSKKAGRFNLDVHALRVKSRYFSPAASSASVKTVMSPPQTKMTSPSPDGKTSRNVVSPKSRLISMFDKAPQAKTISPSTDSKTSKNVVSPKSRLISMFENSPVKPKTENIKKDNQPYQYADKKGLHMYFHTKNKEDKNSSSASSDDTLVETEDTNSNSCQQKNNLLRSPSSKNIISHSHVKSNGNNKSSIKPRLSAFSWSKSNSLAVNLSHKSSCVSTSTTDSEQSAEVEIKNVSKCRHVHGAQDKEGDIKLMESVDYNEFIANMGEDQPKTDSGLEERLSANKSEDEEEKSTSDLVGCEDVGAESQGTVSSQRSISSLSQRGSLGSIDSFCLDGAIDLTNDTDADSQTSTKSFNCSAPRTPSGCRVSGLSRLSNKGTNSLTKFKTKTTKLGLKKSTSQDSRSPGQPSITDMISKYW